MSARLTSFLFKYLSLAVIIPATALSVAAQKPKPSPTPVPEDPQGTVTVTIRRVRLPITVTDKKGQFIPGLTKNDFIILEDKVPQTIETFSDDLSQTTPLYIAVLMDTSPSTAGKLKFQQESAMNFIQTVVKPRKDRVLFGTFDDEINLLQDFTDKLDLLDKAVYSVKKMGTQTALFDAIWQFCDEKMRSVPGRRVLLIVTDGEDTYSRANIRDAIDIAQRTETTIFAISTKAGFLATVPGVEAGQVADKKDKDLLTLAEETGGARFFHRRHAFARAIVHEDLERVTRAVSRHLQSDEQELRRHVQKDRREAHRRPRRSESANQARVQSDS